MTFFANAGIVLPELGQQTADAGASSLRAISTLWNAFANLEGGHWDSDVDTKALLENAGALWNASRIYHEIAIQTRDTTVDQITPAELDLAGVNVPWSFFDESFRWWSGTFFALFLDDPINIGNLYNEVAQRNETLASTISGFASSTRTFGIEQKYDYLAPQAFQIMKQIEALAILGRIISVLNRRKRD